MAHPKPESSNITIPASWIKPLVVGVLVGGGGGGGLAAFLGVDAEAKAPPTVAGAAAPSDHDLLIRIDERTKSMETDITTLKGYHESATVP